MKLSENCGEFTRLLASKEPVPGGGGAAALCGALAVALCSMAGNLTMGKKAYAHVEEEVIALVSEAESLRTRLLQLIDEDAENFKPLSKAYSLPKDSPDREKIMLSATKLACAAPFEMLGCCCRVIEISERMLEVGSRMMVSDVGCGAVLAKAALEAAAMNVYINTKTIKSDEEAAKMEIDTENMLAEYMPRAAAVSAAVMKILHGE